MQIFRECTQHLFFKRKRRKRRTQYYVRSLSDRGLKEEDGKTAGEIQTRTMSWIIWGNYVHLVRLEVWQVFCALESRLLQREDQLNPRRVRLNPGVRLGGRACHEETRPPPAGDCGWLWRDHGAPGAVLHSIIVGSCHNSKEKKKIAPWNTLQKSDRVMVGIAPACHGAVNVKMKDEP